MHVANARWRFREALAGEFVSEAIKYGAVGALILGSTTSGMATATRHLLVVDALGLADIARDSAPQGYARIKALLDHRIELPVSAQERVKRELARALSPITDQVAQSMERAVPSRVGVAKPQALSSGVFLLGAFRGNFATTSEAEAADKRIASDLQRVVSMLAEHNIKALTRSVSCVACAGPIANEELDLEEAPCLEAFGALCSLVAKQAGLDEVRSASHRLSNPCSIPSLARPR